MQPTVTITATRSLAWNTYWCTRKLNENGCGSWLGGTTTLSVTKNGTADASPASTCAIPIVTTMSTSRGAFARWRITRRSTSEPSATAAINAHGSATQNDQPRPSGACATSATHSAAGTAPRSAWAKLITRLERYTSVSPI